MPASKQLTELFEDIDALVEVSDEEAGIERRRRGKGFTYRWQGGGEVRGKTHLERIRLLAVPPAWEEVWICSKPEGHIQATGRDEKGRKQYIYHPLWREEQEREKYASLAAFGRALPRLRRGVGTTLREAGKDDVSREVVLAALVRILDRTLARVGSERYTRQNKSYGLTTLKERHVSLNGRTVALSFTGKSGLGRELEVKDARVRRVVAALLDLPGRRLFRYRDEAGDLHDVRGSDLNRYLSEASGRETTAKEFRTWGGTVAVAEALAACGAPEDEKACAKLCLEAIDGAAEMLGNTRAVCRRHYLHPLVEEAFADGRLAAAFERAREERSPRGLRIAERGVLRLLEEAER